MAEPVHLTPLTPLSFLGRSSEVFPDKTAIIHGGGRLSYRAMAEAATRLAHALQASGVEPGDRVAYLCPNIPELLVAHFGVPLAGAVLVAINTRLSSEEIRYILEHSGARLLVVDTELTPLLEPILEDLGGVEEIVAVDDTGRGSSVPATDLADLMARGDDQPVDWAVDHEDRTISINYTSGTTGRPKGVMYTHRGAHLNALAEVIHSRHSVDSVYLWTLPMFHCNGWCTTWGVTAIGGTHVCLRSVDPSAVWRLLGEEGVTHLNAAPTVLISLANAPGARPLTSPLVVTTAGAPPSPTLIAQMSALGAEMVHVYGLTETYGPYTVCQEQPGWEVLEPTERARLLARQGVAMVSADPIRVVDEEMGDVPRDGSTIGEVVMRGNNVMKGYFDDSDATEQAFRGGWFHSGDLGVWHPDGYIELRDRAKDIIISGGENISTIEVEQALVTHPAVLEVAVVSVPDDYWGERPKAFVVLKSGTEVTEDELIGHVRQRIAKFKAPDRVEFLTALPKTSTGKIQKYVLRDKAWAGRTSRVN
ncbi:MAG TPA: acyl--CoA ligase family protein [Acidimicrobiia bacterium]|nr:acyl--CoA ligase family protein [Acidimicrobiia bacterium]